jgi:glutamate-1-semialdehyde 2,1-aminomutase
MESKSLTTTRTQSLEWYDRATKVIPGGVYGHMSPAASLPLAFPYYADRADGCYFYDVDGNRFLDFMCAYGPIVLGHQHPEVEAAAQAARERGGLFSHPGTGMVELAETLVNRVDFADWCVFGKNGSDMTTWAMQVARQHTGHKKVLVVSGAYHGVDAWTNPSPGGVIEEDRRHIHDFKWNDAAGFEKLVAEHQGSIAAVMINPFHHPAFGPNVEPTSGFIESVNRICKKEGHYFNPGRCACWFSPPCRRIP